MLSSFGICCSCQFQKTHIQPPLHGSNCLNECRRRKWSRHKRPPSWNWDLEGPWTSLLYICLFKEPQLSLAFFSLKNLNFYSLSLFFEVEQAVPSSPWSLLHQGTLLPQKGYFFTFVKFVIISKLWRGQVLAGMKHAKHVLPGNFLAMILIACFKVIIFSIILWPWDLVLQ